MIRYMCDACFVEVEHDGPNLPANWVAIVARVDWSEKGDGQTEQECNARLLCAKCRGDEQDELCARIEGVLSEGLDARPKALPHPDSPAFSLLREILRAYDQSQVGIETPAELIERARRLVS